MGAGSTGSGFARGSGAGSTAGPSGGQEPPQSTLAIPGTIDPLGGLTPPARRASPVGNAIVVTEEVACLNAAAISSSSGVASFTQPGKDSSSVPTAVASVATANLSHSFAAAVNSV